MAGQTAGRVSFVLQVAASMLVRFIASLLKLAVASLATGALLSYLNITTVQILAHLHMTPEDLARMVVTGVDWALPKMFLGAIFVIPSWFMVNLLRPPKGFE
jgi:hypothetical protein